MGAKALSVVLGFWLFLSAFIWEHGNAQFHNAWIVGMLAATTGILALGGNKAPRHALAVLGAWLLVSSFLMEGTTSLTFWNHLFVGVGLVFWGLAPTLGVARRRDPVEV